MKDDQEAERPDATPRKVLSDVQTILASDPSEEDLEDFSDSIYAGEQYIVPLAAEIWNRLYNWELDRGRSLFLSGGHMSRLTLMPDGPKIEPLTPDMLLYVLNRLSKWHKIGKKGRYFSNPPIALVRDMMATPQSLCILPTLRGIVAAPIFTAAGDLLLKPGYDEASGIYYQETFEPLPVPDEIAPAQVAEAVSFFYNEVIPDFPFASQADRANSLALLILPFVREIIGNHPTPMHKIEASLPRSGKGILNRTLLEPGLGRTGIGETPQPPNEAEMEKVISTNVVEATGALCLDNINGVLDSGVLANALTSRTWKARLLSMNRTANAPIRMIWTMTANNPTLSSELHLRCVPIRITPKTDRPEDREGFRHADQLEWVEQNRARIVNAVHILVKWWMQQGRPRGNFRMASFETWSTIMGGILSAARIDGFMSNYKTMRDLADVGRLAKGELFNTWWNKYQTGELKERATAADLWEIARHLDGLSLNGNNEDSLKKSFGQLLAGCADLCPSHQELDENDKPIYERKFQIKKVGFRHKVVLWQIELLEEVDFRAPADLDQAEKFDDDNGGVGPNWDPPF